jgi:hypothetical protein
MVASLAIVIQGNWTGVYTLIAQLALGFWKGANRLRTMRESLPEQSGWLERFGWSQIWLTPVATWIWLAGLLSSALTNEINWRGRRYRLR